MLNFAYIDYLILATTLPVSCMNISILYRRKKWKTDTHTNAIWPSQYSTKSAELQNSHSRPYATFCTLKYEYGFIRDGFLIICPLDTEHLVHARHCFRPLECICEQNRQKSLPSRRSHYSDPVANSMKHFRDALSWTMQSVLQVLTHNNSKR